MKNRNIAVIGLGYVGLQVAAAFGKKQKVIAYDINQKRIKELSDGFDKTGEVLEENLIKSDLFFTSSLEDLKTADFYIVAVPTPIDQYNEPDLSLLKRATESVATVVTKDNIIVFESTVYPGTTEEVCVPILEENSKLIFNKDFFIGYSPERINPGDKEKNLAKINKIF